MTVVIQETPWGTSRTLTLTESEARVLRYILKKGPCHGYTIFKETGLTDKTTYTSIKKLVGEGILSSVPGGDEPHPGRERKICELSLYGFLIGLKLENDLEGENLDRVAKTWSRIWPLVLGKWDYFKRIGQLNNARDYLKEIIILDHMWLSKPYGLDLVTNEITSHFYMAAWNSGEQIPEELIMILNDDEIKTFMIDYLENEISNHEDHIEYLNSILDCIE